MKLRALRLFSIDGRRILLLASVVLLLAFGGVQLSELVSANMLRTDAQSTVSAWAGSLVESADDIPAIIAGAAPSTRTDHLLKDATQMGDIYRYKILDRIGHTVYLSERASYPSVAKATADSPSKRIGEKVLSGGTFTDTGVGNSSDNPHYFA